MMEAGERDCRRCFFTQIPAVHDPFYINAVRPYTWFAAVMLFLAYVIGLLFTLRTHAATIWNTDLDEKKDRIEHVAQRAASHALAGKVSGIDYGGINIHNTLSRMNTAGSINRVDIKESQLYKRILGQSLKQAGLTPSTTEIAAAKKDDTTDNVSVSSPKLKPTTTNENAGSQNGTQRRVPSIAVMGMSPEESQNMVRTMAEMAATAATFAARDATSAPRRTSQMSRTGSRAGSIHGDSPQRHGPIAQTAHHANGAAGKPGADSDLAALDPTVAAAHAEGPSGGHDAPNWGRGKSYAVLLSATIAYAVIAEILVNTVDAVLAHSDIDEKFLGITLFALVPNTTEFLNAISFAMNGNIALSMEIGSAYALQVCLLQIPALVLFSALNTIWQPQADPAQTVEHTFTLIFPQWDMVTVILCVFLLSYMYGEGKSNYFKGSILILSYLVVIVGFYVSGSADVGSPYADPPKKVMTQMVSGMRPNGWVEYGR
jgi:Ca2+:H+ antiporter